jgi:hypothetical protein
VTLWMGAPRGAPSPYTATCKLGASETVGTNGDKNV